MLAMCNVKPVVNDDLQEFIEDTGFSSMQFEILRFMGKHPRAKFNLYVIARAMGTGGTDLGNAVNGLIEKDIIIILLDGNGLITYSLSDNQEIISHIYYLAALDWSEAMALKKQLKEDVVLRY